MKKTIAILAALAMMIAAVGAAAEGTAEIQEPQAALTQTAAHGGRGPHGQMPQMPGNGQMPQMPGNGQMPQMPGNNQQQVPANGQAPQMPDNSQAPQLPGGTDTQGTENSALPAEGQNGGNTLPAGNGRPGKGGRQLNGRTHGSRGAELDTAALVSQGIITQDTADKIGTWMAGHLPAGMLKELLAEGVITQAEFEALSAQAGVQQAAVDANTSATVQPEN